MGHGRDAELPGGQEGWLVDEWCCWNKHLFLKPRSLVSGSHVSHHHLVLSISVLAVKKAKAAGTLH